MFSKECGVKYFECALRFRIAPGDVYGIHQQLDKVVQERSGSRLPYTFYSRKQSASDTQVVLRTAVALGLPGEVMKEIMFVSGQKIRICGSLATIRREEAGGRKREICPPAHELPDYIHYHLERDGVICGRLRIVRSTKFHIIKPGSVGRTSHKIIVPMSQYDAECVIEDVGALEQAYAFGIGRKRIFGFGYMNSIEVLS